MAVEMFVPWMSFWETFLQDVYEFSSHRCLNHHIEGRIEVEYSSPPFPLFAFSCPWWYVLHFTTIATSLEGLGVVSFVFVKNSFIARIVRHHLMNHSWQIAYYAWGMVAPFVHIDRLVVRFLIWLILPCAQVHSYVEEVG